MVYTWYITCICRPDRYVRYKPCQNLMGLFRTFFYNDLPLIYYEYLLDIHSTSKAYQKGTKQTHEVLTRYTRHIGQDGIYMYYTMCIYHVYTIDIPALF